MESAETQGCWSWPTRRRPPSRCSTRSASGRSAGPATFTLLVPNPAHGLHKAVDPEDHDAVEAQGVLDDALPKLSEAAGSQVEGIIGDADPSAAIQDAINLRGFDEVIISTLSPKLSRWLHLDLPSKISGLGLPVTHGHAGRRARRHARAGPRGRASSRLGTARISR